MWRIMELEEVNAEYLLSLPAILYEVRHCLGEGYDGVTNES